MKHPFEDSSFTVSSEKLIMILINSFKNEGSLSFYKFKKYFNWRLVTLQYCGGFCHAFTWISHGCTCVPHPEPPFHLPPHPIPHGHPSAPALSTLSHASNLGWWSISHMIIYMFQCYSFKASSPSPTESNSLFFTSVSLLLSHI